MSATGDTADSETAGQVLEFDLGDDAYCVTIGHVTEIVDMGDLTPVPNAPDHVRGVMDLRGNTTTIVDPKTLLDLTVEDGDRRIIVFDSSLFEDDRSVGWMVDNVREVVSVSQEDVDPSPTDGEHIHGILKREEGFVIWVEPSELHA